MARGGTRDALPACEDRIRPVALSLHSPMRHRPLGRRLRPGLILLCAALLGGFTTTSDTEASPQHLPLQAPYRMLLMPVYVQVGELNASLDFIPNVEWEQSARTHLSRAVWLQQMGRGADVPMSRSSQARAKRTCSAAQYCADSGMKPDIRALSRGSADRRVAQVQAIASTSDRHDDRRGDRRAKAARRSRHCL